MPKVNNIFSWEALPNDVIKDSDLRSIQEVSGGPRPCPGKRAQSRQQISLEQFRAAHGWFSESSLFKVGGILRQCCIVMYWGNCTASCELLAMLAICTVVHW